MPVLDLRDIGEDVIEKLAEWIRSNSRTEFRSVFEELGARSSDEFDLKKVAKHRATLDSIVFDALGLTTNERMVVYQETIRLVHDRFQRVESVETRKSSKRNDTRRLAQSIVDSLDVDVEDWATFPMITSKTTHLKSARFPSPTMPELVRTCPRGISLRLGENRSRARRERRRITSATPRSMGTDGSRFFETRIS